MLSEGKLPVLGRRGYRAITALAFPARVIFWYPWPLYYYIKANINCSIILFLRMFIKNIMVQYCQTNNVVFLFLFVLIKFFFFKVCFTFMNLKKSKVKIYIFSLLKIFCRKHLYEYLFFERNLSSLSRVYFIQCQRDLSFYIIIRFPWKLYQLQKYEGYRVVHKDTLENEAFTVNLVFQRNMTSYFQGLISSW